MGDEYTLSSENDAESDENWRQYYEDCDIEAQRRQVEELEAEAQRVKKIAENTSGADAGKWEVEQRVKNALSYDSRDVEDGWGAMSYYPPPKVASKEKLSWVSPLPDLSTLAEADIITAGGETFTFISRFLAEKRVGGISFRHRHGLISFLLHVVTASAFDFVYRYAPHDLALMQIQHQDQLELKWWLSLISNILHSNPKPVGTEDINWDLLQKSIADWAVGQVRHTAVHRLNYGTDVILYVVKFILAFNDIKRFRQVERTVRILYGTVSDNLVVTDEERAALDTTLALYPTECETTLDLFYTIQGIVESMYFRNAQDQEQGWLSTRKVTVAEQLELYQPEDRAIGWNSCFGFCPVNQALRIMVAHRKSYIASAIFDLDDLQNFIAAIKDVALEFGDDESAAHITEVTDAAIPYLKVLSDTYKARLHVYSPNELRIMQEQAMKKYREWDPTLEDRNNVLAQRYWAASFAFRDLANLLDGIEYRKGLSWVQKAANKAHDSWGKFQRSRYVGDLS